MRVLRLSSTFLHDVVQKEKMSLHRSGAFSAERGQSQVFSESNDERLAESLTLMQWSACWPLEGDQLAWIATALQIFAS